MLYKDIIVSYSHVLSLYTYLYTLHDTSLRHLDIPYTYNTSLSTIYLVSLMVSHIYTIICMP